MGKQGKGDMAEAENDFPEAWRPEGGEDSTEISGKVVGVVLGPDFGWGRYPIVTIATEDGTERAVHARGTVLRSELARRHPKRGDDLEIKYLGKRTPKSGGNDFHMYRVNGGTEPEFNWDAELPPEERSSAAPPIAPAPAPLVQQQPVTTPVVEDNDDSDVPF